MEEPPFFSCDNDFYEGTGMTSYIFPFQFKSSYVFTLPPETLKKRKNFFRNTSSALQNKKQKGNPTINTEFFTCYPLVQQAVTSAKRMISSDRHESPTTLHCQNLCCILERTLSTSFMMLQSPFSSAHSDKLQVVHHERKDSLNRDD